MLALLLGAGSGVNPSQGIPGPFSIGLYFRSRWELSSRSARPFGLSARTQWQLIGILPGVTGRGVLAAGRWTACLTQ